MHRIFILVTAFLIAVSFIGAEETYRFNLGLGVEGNMNARKNMTLGGAISASYGINEILAAGLKFTMSHDFKHLMILEPEVFVRWYFLSLGKFPLFVQGDLGSSLIMDDSHLYPSFMGGLTVGMRFPLERWYVEPYIRGGYPFITGIGITAGLRF
jgi:hypothetical protein